MKKSFKYVLIIPYSKSVHRPQLQSNYPTLLIQHIVNMSHVNESAASFSGIARNEEVKWTPAS